MAEPTRDTFIVVQLRDADVGRVRKLLHTSGVDLRDAVFRKRPPAHIPAEVYPVLRDGMDAVFRRGEVGFNG